MNSDCNEFTDIGEFDSVAGIKAR